MKVDCIGFEESNQFGKLFLDYINQDENLKGFYRAAPTFENIASLTDSYNKVDRTTLVESLNNQYKDTSTSSATTENINSLKSNTTFTITTGHQLNLATGPLFFVFKILATIKTTQALNNIHKDKHFVPVFWMATEDHDFEEINHFHLFGKKYEWNTDQKGAVGRFQTEGIQEVLKELPETITVLEKAYQQPTLSEATRFLVNELFGKYGLVILDADEKGLKESFSSIIKQEITERKSENLVKSSSFELEQLNYKAQVFPRTINLFYLTENSRERIVFEDYLYKVNNTNITFSEEEIIAEVNSKPERFSPNVILRPVYQQYILPNLSYIGGPGEIAYWLQLKSTFEFYKVDFPILQPRAFGLVLDKAIQKKIDKLNLDAQRIFKSFEELKADYLGLHAQEVDLEEEKNELKNTFDTIIEKGSLIDASLNGALSAEWQRFEKQLIGVEKRIKKAEERKHETVLTQYATIKDKLFPNGGLQERHENIFSFLINKPDLIDEILKKIDFKNFIKIYSS